MFDRRGEPMPESAANRLPRWRRERWERLRNEKARDESLAAGLLFAAAMTRWGLSAAEMERVTLYPAGKPVLCDREDLWFSLSHSGRYVLCAVSGKTVGADVQQMRPVNHGIARRFHEGEREWLSRQPEPEKTEALFRLWTRKEAWVKAVSRERMVSLDEADVIHPVSGLAFRDYRLDGGYAAALCAAETGQLPELTEISRDELLFGTF